MSQDILRPQSTKHRGVRRERPLMVTGWVHILKPLEVEVAGEEVRWGLNVFRTWVLSFKLAVVL